MAIEIERSCANCIYKSGNEKVCKKCNTLDEFYLNSCYEGIEYTKNPMWSMCGFTKQIVDNPNIVCFIDKLKVKAQTEIEYKEFKYYTLCVETLLRKCAEFIDSVRTLYANNPFYTDAPYQGLVCNTIENYEYNTFHLLPFDLNKVLKVDTYSELYRKLDSIPTFRVTITGTLKWEDTPCFEAILNVSLTPVVKEIVK